MTIPYFQSIKTIPVLAALPAMTLLPVNLSGQTIESKYLRLGFDQATGGLSCRKQDGQIIFQDCLHAITYEGETYTSGSNHYTYEVENIVPDSEDPGLVISGKDKNNNLDFEARVMLYRDQPALGIEVVYTNVSDHDINAGSIDPLRLTEDHGGYLYFENALKCLTNGAMYYDAGMIQELDKPYIRPQPYGEIKEGFPLDKVLNNNIRTVQSWWNIALFNGYEHESMVIGYLHNRNSLGRIQVLKNDPEQLSLIAESVYNPGFNLKKSEKISSDKIAVVCGDDPYQAVEHYADLMAGEIEKPSSQIINGWCHWFYTMDSFDEDEILRNVEFAAKELRPYGLEYIQIDEGFQTSHGDWQGNNRFPHGLKWLCDRIKSYGFKPGIWISPFVISEYSTVYKQHPGWLLKDKDGKPVRIGPWPSENTGWYKNETPKRYCLDLTRPEAEQWFTELIDTIINHWGFEMIKVDFVAWTIFSANSFDDCTATPVQLYRRAMDIIRTVDGADFHILDCGPGNVSAGYINSMRIEYDQNYGYAPDAWKQYFLGSSCSAGAAGKRYFYHDKLWINDIDHVCIDLLSLRNAQAVSTLISLSGGNVMSGDRLMNLGNTKIDILKKIYPGTIEQGKPADLFDNDPQTIFSCHISRAFAQWEVVAFFNPDQEKSITRQVEFKRLWLDDTKIYLCFDFWNEKFAGEVSGKMEVTVDPGSVVLYSLHEKTPWPRVISTNRHVKQGAVEIADTYFDDAENILHGTSVSPEGSMHSIFVYMPEGYSWSPHNGKIFEYNKHYTIRKVEDHILRIDVMFTDTQTIDWKINFDKI
jgi:hypothetical protein